MSKFSLTVQGLFPEVGILTGGFWLALERVVLAGKGVVLTFLLARYLSQEVFGQYQFLLALLGAFSIFSFPGMGTAIVQALARDLEGTFVPALRAVLRASLWGVGGLLLAVIYYSFKGQYSFLPSLLVLAIFFPSYSISSLWRYYYTGHSDFRGLFTISLILEALSLVSFIPIIIWKPELIWVVMVGIILPTLLMLVVLYTIKSKTEGKPSDPTNVQYGKRLSLTFGFVALAAYFDKLLVGQFLGFADLAVFSLAIMIPEQIKGAVGALVTPVLSHYSKGEKRSELIKHFLYFFMIASLATICVFFIVPPIFHTFFPHYIESLRYVNAMLILILLTPFLSLELYFRAMKDERTVMIATVTGGVGSLILAVLLIPYLGIWGAVISRIAGSSLYAVALVSSLWIKHPVQRSKGDEV